MAAPKNFFAAIPRPGTWTGSTASPNNFRSFIKGQALTRLAHFIRLMDVPALSKIVFLSAMRGVVYDSV